MAYAAAISVGAISSCLWSKVITVNHSLPRLLFSLQLDYGDFHVHLQIIRSFEETYLNGYFDQLKH